MAGWTIAAYYAHDINRDGINPFKSFFIYFNCTQSFGYMGLLMYNISTTWQHYYNTTSMGYTIDQIPQRKGSCKKFYSRDKKSARIGLKHSKNPYPLKRILGMALYK
jgi:hypothetical protein